MKLRSLIPYIHGEKQLLHDLGLKKGPLLYLKNMNNCYGTTTDNKFVRHSIVW